MIAFAVERWRPGPVLRAFRRTRKRTRVIISQTLNRQVRQARTRLTRAVQAQTGVKPQKRIRRRIVIPRSGMANKRRLEAVYLTLLEVTPMRWYRGRPVGKVETLPDTTSANRPSGRKVVNLAQIAYPERQRVQAQLADEWAPEVYRRMRVSFKRIWGGTAKRVATRG